MADLSITASSVIAGPNARRVTKTAGASVTAGQPVYLDAAGKVQPADTNVSALTAAVLGIAENGGATGQPISVVTKDDAFTLGATVAVGDVLIASATAGGIAPVADAASGYYVAVLGVAISTTKINLNPTLAGAIKV